jgi:hypothetical protein
MKVYTGTFLKKNGDQRTMSFVRLNDLPEEFLTARIKGDKKPNTLKEGLELVWDMDVSEFRIFNWATTEGEINEKEIDGFFKQNP